MYIFIGEHVSLLFMWIFVSKLWCIDLLLYDDKQYNFKLALLFYKVYGIKIKMPSYSTAFFILTAYVYECVKNKQFFL